MTGTLKTFILMAGMTALVGFVGAMIGGQNGLWVALGLAMAMNLFSYWNADKIVLRMYRAVEVDEKTAPNYYNTVARLVARADLPMPKVYVIENDQPNAFATGRDPHHAAVAATTGILRMLTSDELEGVMAHELAHVKNRDTLTMTVTATLAGAISMLANFAGMFLYARDNQGNRVNPIVVILFSILAPLAAMVVQMAISRTREFEADRVGATLCGKPQALASALNKISQAAHAIPNMQAENNPATAHLFIINPLHMRSLDGLFSTHPRTEDRIARLMNMIPPGKTLDDGFQWLDDGDTFKTPSSTPPTGFDNPWNRAA